jgi:putative PEP-CTERM system TPR-repeat lipoprotein
MSFPLRPATAGLLGACIALFACTGQSPEALLASAKQYLSQNDTKAATIQLKNVLQKKPDSAEARYLLGKALLDGEDPAGASVELRKAAGLDYPAEVVVPVLAKALLQQGEAKKVTDEYATKTLATPAATANLKTTLAAAYLARGLRAEAATALSAALEAAPGYEPALVLQARMQVAERDTAGAIARLDQVVQQSPDDVDALLLRGDLLASGGGDSAAALDSYRKVLAAHKDNLAAHAGIISIYLARKDLKAAKVQLEALRKVRPNHPQTKYFDAQLALQQGDYKTAKDVIQQLLKIGPNDPRVLQLAGAIAYRSNSPLEAEQYLTKALQTGPGLVYARALLTQLYLQAGRTGDALATIKPALQADQPSAQVLALGGAAYLRSGDSKQAEVLFERAMALDPNDTKTRTALALTRLYRNNAPSALGELESIADSDPGATADIALINANLRRKDVAGALKAIDRLEKKQPDKPLAPNLRGRILMVKGDFAGARRNFEHALSLDANYFPAVEGLAALDLRENKPQQAQQRFDDLLKRQPDNVRALLTVAQLGARIGKSKEEVVGLLSQAVRLKPSDPTARLLLIDYHLQTKDFKQALQAAQDALAALPNNSRLLEGLARAQLASGDTNQAITSFGKLAAAEPKSAQPQLGLADAYAAAGNPDAALEALKRASALAPDSLPVQQKMIAMLVSKGRSDDALKAARTMQARHPDKAVGFALEGDIEAVGKRWPQATAAYRKALQKEISTPIAEKVHASLLAGGKSADADAFSGQWMREHPKDAPFVFYLGGRALADRSYDVAQTRFKQVLELQPDYPPALNNLAWTLATLGKPGATELAERANKLQPNQPAFLDTWAMALAAENRLDKAIELQRKAVSLQPQNHIFRLTLAKLYVRAGDKASARQELEQLTKLGDTFPDQKEVQRLREQL